MGTERTRMYAALSSCSREVAAREWLRTRGSLASSFSFRSRSASPTTGARDLPPTRDPTSLARFWLSVRSDEGSVRTVLVVFRAHARLAVSRAQIFRPPCSSEATPAQAPSSASTSASSNPESSTPGPTRMSAACSSSSSFLQFPLRSRTVRPLRHLHHSDVSRAHLTSPSSRSFACARSRPSSGHESALGRRQAQHHLRL